ncbi:MAG: hypothetical protein QW683_08640 [Candidatus Caldarchaeum sp.]
MKPKAVIILGKSQAGKDTLARRINQFRPVSVVKFAQFAKDWVDQIYGGTYEADRDTDLGGFTKRDILVRLFHAFQETDPKASVRVMESRIGSDPAKAFPEFSIPVFTDARTIHEANYLLKTFDLRVIYIRGGNDGVSSDVQLPDVIRVLKDTPMLVTGRDVNIMEVLTFVEEFIVD